MPDDIRMVAEYLNPFFLVKKAKRGFQSSQISLALSIRLFGVNCLLPWTV